MFLSGFFCSKKNMRNRSIFWQKPWTNFFAKCRFFRLFRTFFLWSKKHSFLSRISKNLSFCLSLLKKQDQEKGQFFDKNHGLTPFQNVDFFEFFRTSLFTSKKHSFLSKKSFFLAYKKKVKFFQKPWTNPFAKCRFFSTLWELHFWGPKSFIFYPEFKKTFLSSFFCLKKTYKKKIDFLTKTIY